jgi:hypothetical protein
LRTWVSHQANRHLAEQIHRAEGDLTDNPSTFLKKPAPAGFTFQALDQRPFQKALARRSIP